MIPQDIVKSIKNKKDFNYQEDNTFYFYIGGIMSKLDNNDQYFYLNNRWEKV